MSCSPPGSSVHGISQARILEWVAISSSRGSSWPRDQTRVSSISYIGRQGLYQLLYLWASCADQMSLNTSTSFGVRPLGSHVCSPLIQSQLKQGHNGWRSSPGLVSPVLGQRQEELGGPLEDLWSHHTSPTLPSTCYLRKWTPNCLGQPPLQTAEGNTDWCYTNITARHWGQLDKRCLLVFPQSRQNLPVLFSHIACKQP